MFEISLFMNGLNYIVNIIFIILELIHKDLVTYVAPHVTTKLQEIGTVLALAPPELDDIEENHQGITGVFQLWYKTHYDYLLNSR